jgi:ABC-2 type transport system permease protein
MRKYALVFRLAAQELFEYRFDFIASTSKYALMVIMMALIWTAVSRETTTLPLTNQETIRYFFFSAMLFSLSNFHTSYIEDDIRLGHLNKFLLKPISAFWYYFVYESAAATIETFIKIVVMVPLLWLLGFGFSVELPHLLLSLAFFPLIFAFAFTFYSLISGLSFWITEAFAIRWAVTILLRFVAGTLLPISFLPQAMQSVMYWLPFQHLAFTPIQILQNQMSLIHGLGALAILIGWTISIQLARYQLWKAGYTQFEGSGI